MAEKEEVKVNNANSVTTEVENNAIKTAEKSTTKKSTTSKSGAKKTSTKKSTTKKSGATKKGSGSKASGSKTTTKKTTKKPQEKKVEETVTEVTEPVKPIEEVSVEVATENTKALTSNKPNKKKVKDKKKKAKAAKNIEAGAQEEKIEEIRKPRILSPEEVNPKLKKQQEQKEKQEKKKKRRKGFDIEQVERFEVTAKQGLNAEQVQKRIDEHLTNKVENKNVKTYKSIFFGNIFTFFNMLCFVVAGALIAVGAWTNLLFLAIILCNIVIGIIQEIRAKKTIEKISLVSAPTATVVRDGHKQDISVDDVVMDDVIFFTTGKQICADCHVIEGEVEVNESLLTGESVAVKKRKGDVLYSGSFISSGKCTAVCLTVAEITPSSL